MAQELCVSCVLAAQNFETAVAGAAALLNP